LDSTPALASALASAEGTAPTPTPSSAPTLAPPPGGEAHRSTVPRLDADPSLVPHLAVLRDHFGPAAKGPYLVQHVALADQRAAVLVARADETDPIALAFDRDQLLWSKLRPAAGIVAPVNGLTLTARPDGGAGVFGWVASLHLVAARMWADDGNPFGDFELFAPDACDALSAAYAPGQGWYVVCTSPQGGRAQRMRDDATIAWPHSGIPIGSTGKSGPAAIVFDTGASFMLVERVPAVGGDHVLAYRYDLDGQPLWATPADLGADAGSGSEKASRAARLEPRVVREGLVRLERPSGVAGKSSHATEVASSGDVHFP
jgi:hypothetical protein